MLNNGFPLTVIWHVHIYQCLLEPSERCNVSTPGSDHTWLYCCDNFEDINNTCIECEIGYRTLKGKPCQPCSGGYYGRRCVESCECKQNERCDHVVGCLELSTIDDKSFYTGHATIEESITVLFPAENITRNQYASSIQNLYTYMYGGGGVFGFILICTIFYKIRSYKSTKVFITQDLETNATETGFESVYEEIDETDLDEIIQQSHLHTSNMDETSTSSSDDTDKNSASNCDDYLNPYQSILEHTENHAYRSTSNVVSDSSIERCEGHSIRVDNCNPISVNVENGERIAISTDNSKCIDLKYSDLEIDTQNRDNDLNRYENTRIFQTEKKSTPQNKAKCDTAYAEIIHTVV